MDTTAVWVVAVVFVATLIRSAFGFGEALLAVPLLALFLPVKTAAPLAVLVSITIAAVVVAQDWRKIHVRSVGWLVASTIVGTPVGLMLLASRHQRAVMVILAVLIMAFSVFSLVGKKPPELKSDSKRWVLGSGFLAGVLGGAYGMNGPPLVIYGAMRRWSAQHFRATLQGYFLPASLIGMAGYWFAGLWVPAVTHYYLVSLPATLVAVFLGRIINHRLHGENFLRYIYLVLICIGGLLIVQATTGRL